MEFDYYYGMEAEQFSFYRIPRTLVKDKRFKGLSSDAKLLYGMMLDRMSLSIKNGWLDEGNRAYIIYTVENIMEDLGCAKGTCVKIMKELDSEKGIGLIEKKRRGLGKPDIIYVKNFSTIGVERNGATPPDTDKTTEVQNLNFWKSRNCTSGGSDSEPLEVQNLDPNYTDINYTENSYTEDSQPDIPSNPSCQSPDVPVGTDDGIDKMDYYRHIIHRNIEYEYLGKDKQRKEGIDELVELMVDVMLMPDGSTVRIAGAERPVEVVKMRFMGITGSHIQYVCGCLERNTGRVGNIKAYLLAALYNSTLTMDQYYQAEVRHDLYGGWPSG
ncbi:MAG: replication initiator protein A [Lachnospiraceae bacterium]|nr:replication initiator protein A [Lachnospiraceae bacterium]